MKTALIVLLVCVLSVLTESPPKYQCDPPCSKGRKEVCELRILPDCKENCEATPTCVIKIGEDIIASSNSTDCPENEEFKECGSACEPKCGQPPQKFCTMNCIDNVCQCKVGFVRNSKKQCVRAEQCETAAQPTLPATCALLKCPEGMNCQEDPTRCIKAPCPNRGPMCVATDPSIECKDIKCPNGLTCQKDQIRCVRAPCPQPPAKCIKPQPVNPCAFTLCEKGTECRVKDVQCIAPPCDPIAECVPVDEPKCPENEVFNSCGGCDNTCENRNMLCPAVCLPKGKCRCKPGFFRHGGKCIQETECPASGNTKCGNNEELKECGTACEPSCINPKPQICTEQCLVNVCQCKEGFVRDVKMGCVELDQCLKPYPEDPCEFLHCPPGQKCERQDTQCLNPPCIQTGKCVPATPECPENEKWNGCGACDSTCENPNMMCPAICRFPGSCGCNPGFVRHYGKCIPRKECPAQTCGENEEFTKCGTACEPSCTTPKPDACIDTQQCIENVCQCKKGFFRDRNRKCVSEDQCPKVETCKTKKCPAGTKCHQLEIQCDFTNCNPPTAPGVCVPDESLCNVVKCTAETECKVQESECKVKPCPFTAQCVPKGSKTCGLNEEFTKCGTACEPSCENPKPEVCTEQCIVDVCQCKKGFVRDGENGCVKLDQCPAAPTCGKNEEFKKCGTYCEPTCLNPEPRFCKSMCLENVCQCKEGFVRDEKHGCVKPSECPAEPTCDENEEFTKCGTACEPSCENPEPAFCTKQCIVNVCQCKKGFVRKQAGKCVSSDQCKTDPQSCDLNEEFKKCGTACEASCENPEPKMCTKQCIVDVCQCKAGFVRDGNNVCVKKEHCSAVIDPKNPCATTKCPKDSKCENTPTQCLVPPCDLVAVCVPNLQRCPENEKWNFCQACDSTCENPNKICTRECRLPGSCGCQHGFLRHKGKCIPKTECPASAYNCKTKKCPDGTICIQAPADCESPTCSLPYTPPLCVPDPSLCNVVKCAAGTECKVHETECEDDLCPFAAQCVPKIDLNNPCATLKCPKDTKCENTEVECVKAPCYPVGVCVPDNQRCPENEKWNFCQACDSTCENPNKICTKECRLPGSCGCQHGFVRYEGKCVAQKECSAQTCETKVCPKGERCEQMMVKCRMDAPCVQPPPTCVPDVDQNPCALIDCEDGFTCVNKPVTCIKEPCSPIGVCVPSGSLETCETKKCPVGTKCIPRTVTCIRPPCSPTICEPDASLCHTVKCDAETECKVQRSECNGKDCPFTAQCVPKPETCDTKKCPAGTKCYQALIVCFDEHCNPPPNPPPQCIPDETLCHTVKCTAETECKVQESECKEGPCPFTAQCVPKVEPPVTCANVRILCKEGEHCQMVDGKPACVPENKKECGLFEEFKECGTACEPSCKKPETGICTRNCVPNVCQCKNGYVRDENGRCVKPLDCKIVNPIVPLITCEKAGNICEGGESCLMIHGKPSCVAVQPPEPRMTLCEIAGQICQEGEDCKVVDGKPTCVPVKPAVTCENARLACKEGQECGMVNGKPTCVPACGENEYLDPCSNVCEGACANIGKNIACRPECSRGPKCACKKDFYRNKEGKCVVEKECPKPKLTCADLKCADNEDCAELNGEARCVIRDQARPPCWGFDCPEGKTCKEVDHQATCE